MLEGSSWLVVKKPLLSPELGEWVLAATSSIGDVAAGGTQDSGLKNLERVKMPDLDALAAMHCLLAWCDLRLALLLGGHWTTALQVLQVVVKGSGAEGASARDVGDLAWAALASGFHPLL